jgi:hypothetical protein
MELTDKMKLALDGGIDNKKEIILLIWENHILKDLILELYLNQGKTKEEFESLFNDLQTKHKAKLSADQLEFLKTTL